MIHAGSEAGLSRTFILLKINSGIEPVHSLRERVHAAEHEEADLCT